MAIPSPSALSLPWRTDGALIRVQPGEQPADSDQEIGRFTDPAIALAAVQAHNASLAGL